MTFDVLLHHTTSQHPYFPCWFCVFFCLIFCLFWNIFNETNANFLCSEFNFLFSWGFLDELGLLGYSLMSYLREVLVLWNWNASTGTVSWCQLYNRMQILFIFRYILLILTIYFNILLFWIQLNIFLDFLYFKFFPKST